jgi:hypothetical protein
MRRSFNSSGASAVSNRKCANKYSIYWSTASHSEPIRCQSYHTGANTAHPAYYIHTLAVVDAQLLVAQGIHALIGRDVLSHCLLTYNGTTNLFTLTY